MGNSYTYFNQLPAMVEELAAAGGHLVQVGQSTPGGFSLQGHLQHAATLDLIADRTWDVVYLQEQSQMPVIEHWRETSTLPAARGLDSLVRLQDAETRFFMTWGRESGGQQCIDGWCSPDFADFTHMQDSLAAAYRRMAVELAAGLAPVGEAWQAARDQIPGLALWNPDHSHPSLIGSYLAACVFYVDLFGESPAGLTYTGGLTPELAASLQELAGPEVGLEEPDRAGIGIELLPAWPNPFNGTCRIELVQERSSNVLLEVVDLAGRRKALLHNGPLGAARHEFAWNPLGQPSGFYLVHLKTQAGARTRTLSLVR